MYVLIGKNMSLNYVGSQTSVIGDKFLNGYLVKIIGSYELNNFTVLRTRIGDHAGF